MMDETMDQPGKGQSGPSRRNLVFAGGIAAGVALTDAALGKADAQTRTDGGSTTLDGQAMPEPPADKTAGPIKPGRGSTLTGRVAVVTGAARGIGRAIAVEMAANGADVVVIDIAGPVSPASDAAAATPSELDETVRQIKAYGRRSEAIRADIRDIAGLRSAADTVQNTYGRRRWCMDRRLARYPYLVRRIRSDGPRRAWLFGSCD